MTSAHQHQMSRSGRPCDCGDHLFAPATKGYVLLVSPEDAGYLQHMWQAQISHRSLMITRKARTGRGHRETILLSREILGCEAGVVADHISGDGADNRRTNLRKATPQQNAWNARPMRNTTAGAKGVSLTKNGRFQAQIMVGGHRHYLGKFSTEREAAMAYERAARELHGDFARVE